MIQKFKKVPVVIEAVQYDGTNAEEIEQWSDAAAEMLATVDMQWIEIETFKGIMTADVGDWIIKGVKGEFYPCKPDIFAMTYTPAGGRVMKRYEYSLDGMLSAPDGAWVEAISFAALQSKLTAAEEEARQLRVMVKHAVIALETCDFQQLAAAIDIDFEVLKSDGETREGG